jgi:glycosyltransferase involved in cell wall biosynthesis
MSTPLVSVLIPCYNAERWVADTLDSAFAQTWPNIEVVLVNDGSTDGTSEVLERFRPLGLKVIETANCGQTAALNRCLKEAAGEYIQYLDADDLMAPDKIAIQMARLAKRGGYIACAEWARFSENPSMAEFKPYITWRDMAPMDWLVANWDDGGGMMYPAMWLLPRKIVDRIGPWRDDLTLANDTEYFTRAVLASEGVLFCSGARTFYRSGIPGSLSGTKTRRGWRSQYDVIDACVARLLDRETSDRTRRVSAMLWQRFAQACYPHDPRLANTALAHATRLHADKLKPDGGNMFKLISLLLGWKVARLAQRLAGRP